MVLGCLEWQEIGLAPPTIVKEAVAEYRRDEDILGDFIQDCCVVKDGCSVKSADVYTAFKIWWQGNVSHRPPSAHKFGKWFGGRFERQKTPYVTYLGVGLLAENPDFDLLSK
jgi:putative DNA primase/helicase